MANEKDGKDRGKMSAEEKDRDENPVDGQEEAPPKKKRSKLLLFILLFLMLLAGSAAGAYFFYGDQILARYIGSDGADGSPAKKVAEKKKGGEAGPILTLEPFIFNLAGNSSRFAKVSLAIRLQNAKALEEAKKMAPVLRDKALMVLSAKSAEELINVARRDSIKVELQNGLKSVFIEKEDLDSVYITDIIIP